MIDRISLPSSSAPPRAAELSPSRNLASIDQSSFSLSRPPELSSAGFGVRMRSIGGTAFGPTGRNPAVTHRTTTKIEGEQFTVDGDANGSMSNLILPARAS